MGQASRPRPIPIDARASDSPIPAPASSIFMAGTFALSSSTRRAAASKLVLKFRSRSSRHKHNFEMAGETIFRTVIVDDETHARARIRQLLKDQADFEVVAECANGRQAIETIQRQKPDLAFLDIQMPRLSGLDVCEAAAASGAPMPLVIFVTAYDE